MQNSAEIAREQHEPPIFYCTIPGRVGIKKNAKRVYRGIPFSSARYMRWERMAKPYIVSARNEAKIYSPLEGRIKLLAQFYFENHQGEPDIDNCLCGPFDLLHKLQVIKDDKQIMMLISNKFFGEMPRTEIKLWEIK